MKKDTASDFVKKLYPKCFLSQLGVRSSASMLSMELYGNTSPMGFQIQRGDVIRLLYNYEIRNKPLL